MNKEAIRNILKHNGSIEYKGLFIGPMPKQYTEGFQKRGGWQVHVEHDRIRNIESSKKVPKNERGFYYGHIYSKIFFELDEAIEKFLGYKELLYAVQKSKTNDSGSASK